MWWNRIRYSDAAPSSDGRPQAAVLAPVYEDGDETRLILTKRPMTMPTHAGHLAFPGGRPDPGDLDVVATALRETEEEIGIPASDIEILGFLPHVDTVEFSLMVVPVVGRVRSLDRLHPSDREVERLLFPTLDELADESGWTHELWRGHRVWFFPVEDEILWGATARMVRELLGMGL